jgi:preprotein translocase subunit Sss1
VNFFAWFIIIAAALGTITLIYRVAKRTVNDEVSSHAKILGAFLYVIWNIGFLVLFHFAVEGVYTWPAVLVVVWVVAGTIASLPFTGYTHRRVPKLDLFDTFTDVYRCVVLRIVWIALLLGSFGVFA